MKAYIKDGFKDLLEYRSWLKEKFDKLVLNKKEQVKYTREAVESSLQYDSSWYGKTTFDELENGITEFYNPTLIDKLYQQVTDKISVELQNKLKVKKVNYNAMGLGVFVFDRAAMGMFRNKEYYAVKHKQVVDAKEVNFNSNPITLKKDKSEVTERWEEKEDGKPKVRTNSKKVFAFYPPKDKTSKSVELIISPGANAYVTADKFLYSGIAAIITAELLEKARIKTRISVVFGSEVSGSRFYGSIVPVKNYDEKLDSNLLAILTSDPRFFRFEGFKGDIACFEEFGEVIPPGYGKALTGAGIAPYMREYGKDGKLSPNCFYFGGTFSETDALSMVRRSIEEISKRLNN